MATSIIVPEGKGRWTEYAGGWTGMIAQRGSAPFSLLGAVKPAKTEIHYAEH